MDEKAQNAAIAGAVLQLAASVFCVLAALVFGALLISVKPPYSFLTQVDKFLDQALGNQLHALWHHLKGWPVLVAMVIAFGMFAFILKFIWEGPGSGRAPRDVTAGLVKRRVP